MKHILVVDDEPTVQRTIQLLLESQGYQVLVADTAAHALLVFGRNPQIAAAVIDLSMPKISGEQLAETLRDSRPQLPIVYVTGHDASVYEPNPPAEVLQKPFSLELLATALKRVLPLCLLGLLWIALCAGCAPMAPHKLMKEVAKDRSVLTGTVTTIYGNGRFTRIGETTNSVTVSPDGTVTINK